MTTIAITGHRPEKISDRDWLIETLSHVFILAGADKVIQGCASGTDLISAFVAKNMGIPYVAAKPWENHKGRMGGSSGFTNDDAIVYDKMIESASEVVNVTGKTDYPGSWAYFARNEWMVDEAMKDEGIVVAVWDGTKSGTRHCVEYALKNNCRVFRLDPLKNRIVGWIEEV